MTNQQELGLVEMRMLDFERTVFAHPVSKENAVAEQFGMGQTEYFQRLNRLLDEPAAMYYRPQVVARLRRLRDKRRGARSLPIQ